MDSQDQSAFQGLPPTPHPHFENPFKRQFLLADELKNAPHSSLKIGPYRRFLNEEKLNFWFLQIKTLSGPGREGNTVFQNLVSDLSPKAEVLELFIASKGMLIIGHFF